MRSSRYSTSYDVFLGMVVVVVYSDRTANSETCDCARRGGDSSATVVPRPRVVICGLDHPRFPALARFRSRHHGKEAKG
jgi:hypothetical protein